MKKHYSYFIWIVLLASLTSCGKKFDDITVEDLDKSELLKYSIDENFVPSGNMILSHVDFEDGVQDFIENCLQGTNKRGAFIPPSTNSYRVACMVDKRTGAIAYPPEDLGLDSIKLKPFITQGNNIDHCDFTFARNRSFNLVLGTSVIVGKDSNGVDVELKTIIEKIDTISFAPGAFKARELYTGTFGKFLKNDPAARTYYEEAKTKKYFFIWKVIEMDGFNYNATLKSNIDIGIEGQLNAGVIKPLGDTKVNVTFQKTVSGKLNMSTSSKVVLVYYLIKAKNL